MLSSKSGEFFKKLYEWILVAFIIVAPINNALNDNGIYAMVAYMAMLVLSVGTVCGMITGVFRMSNKMGSVAVAVVLIIELIMFGTLTNLVELHGPLSLLLYAQFCLLTGKIDTKKIFMAFYMAVAISAMVSIYYGLLSSNSVTRTATMVDGSIAPIAVAIALFADEDFPLTRTYSFMKMIALACALVVALFGMSRSRLLLIGIVLIVKMVFSMRSSVGTGKVSQNTLIMIPIMIILILFAVGMDVTQELFTAVGDRYESGFEDAVRDAEIRAGWDRYKVNWLFGNGWFWLYYKDRMVYRVYYNHCMYVAFLCRGGTVFSVAMYRSIIMLIKRCYKSKQMLPIVMLCLILALGYGNAGLFNYTICSSMIPLVISLEKYYDSVQIIPEEAATE